MDHEFLPISGTILAGEVDQVNVSIEKKKDSHAQRHGSLWISKPYSPDKELGGRARPRW